MGQDLGSIPPISTKGVRISPSAPPRIGPSPALERNPGNHCVNCGRCAQLDFGLFRRDRPSQLRAMVRLWPGRPHHYYSTGFRIMCFRQNMGLS